MVGSSKKFNHFYISNKTLTYYNKVALKKFSLLSFPLNLNTKNKHIRVVLNNDINNQLSKN